MLTDREVELVRNARRRLRTDPLALAKTLGMDKMVEHVHRPIGNFLNSFTKVQGSDLWDGERFTYTPLGSDPADVLQDPLPRRLILAPRSWFKTSLNVITHSIQILLNFPDATILIIHASGETAEEMLGIIKRAFHNNDLMRYYFPEYCSPLDPRTGKTAKEFGKQQQFNLPNRKKWTTAPSCSVAGIETKSTGMHYHWMKFTDIVDDKNTATKDQIEKIIAAYGMARNLLIAPKHHIDIEGTTYHFSDLYGRIIDEWHKVEQEISLATAAGKVPKRSHAFRVFVMGCYKKDLSGTGRQKDLYLPDELNLPYLLDAQGNKISRFPEEWPTEKLEALRTDPVIGESLFASQQLNNPVETDNVVFSLNDIQWKDPDDIVRIPYVDTVTTVDLAETVGKRSDFTTITTTKIDRMNRRTVVDIRHGKFLPDRIVDELFMVQLKWRPRVVKIEETGFARGLAPALLRRSELTKIYINIEYIKRDNQVAKQERIMSLQPWFRQRLIYFSTALEDHVKEQLKHELTRFPKYIHDDILDTLADQLQNEPIYGPMLESKTMAEHLQYAQNAMLARHEEYCRIYGPQATPTNTAWEGLGGS